MLARFGLVKGSFIPPHDIRELRLVSRYRRKLSAMRASELNRLHKTLDDGVWDLLDATSMRALRGVAYHGSSIRCRPAFRNRNSPDFRNFDIGVRLVRLWLPHSEPRTP